MDEQAPLDETVLWIAAVIHPVDAAQIFHGAEPGVGGRRHLGAGQADGLGHPLGGARVGREQAEPVGRAGPPGEFGPKRAFGPQALEESGYGHGIVAEPRHVADAQHVGLGFLFAGKATERERGTERGALPEQPVAGEDAERVETDPRGERGAIALRGVAGGEVADLVGDDAGELRLVVGQRHEARGDVDIATG